jgi:glycine/D-amino acid oxidase-like deaminating enzyme
MADLPWAIVGGGLAGTTLQWAFHLRGVPSFILDAGPSQRASQVAAGLMTPITGKRFNLSWRWHELFDQARTFYQAIEAELGQTLFLPRCVVRLFQTQTEREKHLARLFAHHADVVSDIAPPLNRQQINAPHGGFAMPTAGQLDVTMYLAASQAYFIEHGQYHTQTVPANCMNIPGTLGVIFCQGAGLQASTAFAQVPLRRGKGEVLEVEIPGYTELRVLNNSLWLAPTHTPGVYRAGATYAWNDTTPDPTAAGRAEIETRLRQMLRCNFSVRQHLVGIRPITPQQRPWVGRHPQHHGLYYFNGLSSKGALLAPTFATQLVNFLLDGTPLDPDCDLQERLQATQTHPVSEDA